MYHYVCYLQNNIKDSYLADILSHVFKCKKCDIGELLEDGDFKIRYENRSLDEESEFNNELNVYVDSKEKILELSIYNNLLFGIKFFNSVNESVLVNDESDNPYQWISIKQEGIFLVEECDSDEVGINLSAENSYEISLNKALMILPDKSNIEREDLNSFKQAYFVKPSSLWKSCIK